MRVMLSYKKILAVALAMWPILDVYKFFAGISLGEIFVLISIVGCILAYRKLEVDRIRYFYLYLMVISIIWKIVYYRFNEGEYFQNVLSYVLYAFFLISSLAYIDSKEFAGVYLKISTIVCYISLIQFIMLYAGVKLVEIVPFLPNNVGLEYYTLQTRLVRMCGPFTEPAHLVQYLSVGIILMLFIEKTKKRLLILHLVTTCLTLSGNGIAIVGSILGVKALFNLKEKNKKIFGKTIVLIIVGIIGLIVLYSKSLEFRRLIMRISEISGNSNIEALGYVSASGYFRVRYGFDIFANLPVLNQIFGVGVGVFSDIYRCFNVVPTTLVGTYGEALLMYRSGITTILIDSGLVGMAIYLSYMFKSRGKNACQVGLILIIMQTIASVINTSVWVLFILLINMVDSNSLRNEEIYIEEV